MTEIPDKIKCKICSEVCKRGVRVNCCNTVACRACATKSITTNRVCWNDSCKQSVTTAQLVNDENLRQQVDRFSKGEEVDETVLLEITVKQRQDDDQGPPVKKTKTHDNKTDEYIVHFQMMKQRNIEFDKCLLPEEKNCVELRYGAQLELIFEFSEAGAECLMCSEECSQEAGITHHFINKHRNQFDNMKKVLREHSEELAKQNISKAIQSEFVYAAEQRFPCNVEL